MAEPLVHVLVINWNGLEHVQECFDSLLRSTYSNARFVLIDNASQDGSAEFVRRMFGSNGRVDILTNAVNLGWSRGNNVGIQRALDAGADYVFLLNNDTATSPDAIGQLVEAAESHPEAGALAPKMLLYGNPHLINSVGIECSIIGNAWDLGFGRLDGPKWNAIRAVTGVCGGAAFYRSAALRRAGLLPGDFDIYLDDLDLSLRIWNAGFEILNCPGAVIRHKFSATMGSGTRERRKYYLNTRNRLRLVLRNFPFSQWPRAAAWGAVGEGRALGRAILEGQWWRTAAHVRAWCAAAASAPADWAARRSIPAGSLAQCPFWHLIRTDTLFFPGTPLPDKGWYDAVRIGDELYHPISSAAQMDVQSGRLRLAFANCYPHLGCMDIDIFLNGHPIASTRASERDEKVVAVEGGLIEFRANRVFDADDTGERADVGGWLNVEPV